MLCLLFSLSSKVLCLLFLSVLSSLLISKVLCLLFSWCLKCFVYFFPWRLKCFVYFCSRLQCFVCFFPWRLKCSFVFFFSCLKWFVHFVHTFKVLCPLLFLEANRVSPTLMENFRSTDIRQLLAHKHTQYILWSHVLYVNCALFCLHSRNTATTEREFRVWHCAVELLNSPSRDGLLLCCSVRSVVLLFFFYCG